jgi:hypothetical protein
MMTPDMDRLLAAPHRPTNHGAGAVRPAPPRTNGGPRVAPSWNPGRPAVPAPGTGVPPRAVPAPGIGAPPRAARHGFPPPPPVPAERRPSRTPADRPPLPAANASHPSKQLPARRIVMGVLIGALTMFGVATLDTFAGATVPVLGSLAALPGVAGEPDVVEVPAPPATPGTCLMWSRSDAADTKVVDCAQPHLFEQAGSVALVDQATLPDDRQWRQLVNERCTQVVLDYMGGKFDPDGRYRVGALKPSPAKWTEGDRELRCGLQSSSRSGALYPLAGRAASSDQSAVHDPGTCLAIDGRTIGDPVDCAGPHAVETVGIVDLSEKFPDAFPAVGDQDAFLQPECGRIANEYAGSADVIAAKKLTVYWDNLTEDSWKAGTRKVNCNLAALLPDRSGFAPVTGPVRGEVVVGENPAPPASQAPGPGVPAPTSTVPVEPPVDGPPNEQPPPSGAPGDEEPPVSQPELPSQPPEPTDVNPPTPPPPPRIDPPTPPTPQVPTPDPGTGA